MKIVIQWHNGYERGNEGVPCIYAKPSPLQELPEGLELYAEYVLSPDECDDFEPTDEADARAAEYLRKEITAQAEAAGISAESLVFRF